MGGGSDHIAVLKRARNDASSYQARDVGHVSEEIGIVLITNFTETFVVQVARVAGHT